MDDIKMGGSRTGSGPPSHVFYQTRQPPTDKSRAPLHYVDEIGAIEGKLQAHAPAGPACHDGLGELRLHHIELHGGVSWSSLA